MFSAHARKYLRKGVTIYRFKMADRSIESILQLKGLKKDFREVILTLEDVIIPEDRLYPTPSMTDNLTYDQECDLRIYGCELIQTSGELLDLPQVY